MCRHVVECGNDGTERMSAAECSESCSAQQALYEEWTDTVLRADFEESLRCYNDASCGDLASGACYDPEVWTY